jgi:hypothetical protein
MRAVTEGLRGWCRDVAGGWNWFWFSPADPITLGAVRVATGLVLLYVHLSCLAQVPAFLGADGWIDRAAMDRLRAPETVAQLTDGWWGRAVWCHMQDPTLVWAVYAVFLAAAVCFTLGLFSRTASVLVWVGHLSYVQRGVVTWFGMDTILAVLTLYLMLGPSGATLSLDARRARRRASPPQAGPVANWSANLVVRLIQVHLCLVYLCAGLSKLQGARWWDGTAVWLVMVQQEFALADLTGLAHAGDGVCLLVSNLGVVLTLVLEVGFPFLVWNRRLRPVLLLLAVALHAGIGLVMGMGAFGAAMLAGCLAFVEPVTVRRWIGSFRAPARPAPQLRVRRAA